MDINANMTLDGGIPGALNKKALLSLPAPNPQAFSDWAKALFGSNRLSEALDVYNECLKLDPQDVNSIYNRGLIKGLLKDKEGALSDFSLVLLELGVFDMPLLIVRDKEAIFESIIEDAKAIFQPACGRSQVLSEVQAELEEINKDLGYTLKVLLESPDASKETSANSSEQGKDTEMINGRITQIGHCVPHERLSDVQGLQTVKETMWNNVVLPILRPDLFHKYKKKRSYAVLLYGPPGCGKTLLVRALAGETNSCVVLAKLHEMRDMYIGNTEKNIHSLFEEARALTRNNSRTCIVFLDELDSLGVNRGFVSRETTGSHRDSVNQLLAELDGLERNPEGLFVVAASNRPWDVDAALKRSGRIGETIYINPPTHEDRICLFDYYLGGCVIGEIDLEKLAKLTDGCSAADIEAIVDKAKLRPIKREHRTGSEDALSMADLEDVIADPATGKGSLGDWYRSVADEISQKAIDASQYKPLVNDVKKFLQNSDSTSMKTPCV